MSGFFVELGDQAREPTLAEAIEEAHAELRELYEHAQEFDEQGQQIVADQAKYEAYKSAVIQAVDEHNEPEEWLAENLPVSILQPQQQEWFALSCIHAIKAEQALQLNGRDSAWYQYSLARHYMGLRAGAYRDAAESLTGSQGRGLGGKRKGDTYKPVRIELIRLLKEHRPVGGWRNPGTVLNTLEGPLSKYAATKNGGYPVASGIRATIRRWLTAHDDVLAAFEGREE